MSTIQEDIKDTERYQIQKMLKKPWAPYVIPFFIFIILTAPVAYLPDFAHLLYTAKTFLVGTLLWLWRNDYAPDFANKLTIKGYIIAVIFGIVTLIAWILFEAIFPPLGNEAGFNPYSFGCLPTAVPILIAIRLAGAVLVVPVMEELFWRSFLLRYLINPDFKKVSLGTFSWFSFISVAVLFGLEHHLWIQGIFAGVVYTLLLVQQKSLRGATIAHATTNLGLGIYVITTQNWIFW